MTRMTSTALTTDESVRLAMISRAQYTYRMTVTEYERYLTEADAPDIPGDLANVIAGHGKWVLNSHHSYSADSGAATGSCTCGPAPSWNGCSAMPSFTVKTVEQLADFIIPMTADMANEIVAYARTRDDRTGVTAIYYWGGNPAKRTRRSVLVTVVLDTRGDPLAFVWTGEYHPRAQGRAHFVHKTEQYVHD